MPDPVIRFRIDFSSQAYVGPGKVGLLEAIRDSGSISQAARNLGMSYRRAWLLLESINESFSEPATIAKTGGKGGGGVELTKFGNVLIKCYRKLDGEIARAGARQLRTIASAVKPGNLALGDRGRRSIARKR